MLEGVSAISDLRVLPGKRPDCNPGNSTRAAAKKDQESP